MHIIVGKDVPHSMSDYISFLDNSQGFSCQIIWDWLEGKIDWPQRIITQCCKRNSINFTKRNPVLSPGRLSFSYILQNENSKSNTSLRNSACGPCLGDPKARSAPNLIKLASKWQSLDISVELWSSFVGVSVLNVSTFLFHNEVMSQELFCSLAPLGLRPRSACSNKSFLLLFLRCIIGKLDSHSWKTWPEPHLKQHDKSWIHCASRHLVWNRWSCGNWLLERSRYWSHIHSSFKCQNISRLKQLHSDIQCNRCWKNNCES